jgi:hypothetical protein
MDGKKWMASHDGFTHVKFRVLWIEIVIKWIMIANWTEMESISVFSEKIRSSTRLILELYSKSTSNDLPRWST